MHFIIIQLASYSYIPLPKKKKVQKNTLCIPYFIVKIIYIIMWSPVVGLLAAPGLTLILSQTQ